MGKYLIAGPPGSGKSSVIRELQSKNITAYDADSYPGMTLLEDNNGNHVPWPSGAIDWKKYQWNWQLDLVRKMLKTKKNVFTDNFFITRKRDFNFVRWWYKCYNP